MASLDTVPVVDVQNDNFKQIWPTLILAMKTATFVAIDTELSGLGDRRKLNAKSIDDRYLGMCEVAKSRSILSLGLSCFRLAPEADTKCKDEKQTTDDVKSVPAAKTKKGVLHFVAQTFNIMLLCSEDYVVEPKSLRFLVNHGFDFNRQYATGISYYRGNDQGKKETQSVRQLFTELVRNQVPVVFHNGLVDLIFLYQCFYANLPTSMAMFLADIAEVFAGGVYDTKYLAEFHARYPASYLEYVFRKSQRDNEKAASSGDSHVKVQFLAYPADYPVTFLPCRLPIKETAPEKHINICEPFAAYGWCHWGSICPLSHDVDLILDNEDFTSGNKRRKRRRRWRSSNVTKSEPVDMETEQNSMDQQAEVGNGTLEEEEDDEKSHEANVDVDNSHEMGEDDKKGLCEDDNGAALSDSKSTEKDASEQGTSDEGSQSGKDKNPSRTEGHRAGFDAFMTGYMFAEFLTKHGTYNKRGDLPESPSLSDLGMQEYANKVSLGGKDIPLQIVKSSFAKTSKDHNDKMKSLQITG